LNSWSSCHLHLHQLLGHYLIRSSAYAFYPGLYLVLDLVDMLKGATLGGDCRSASTSGFVVASSVVEAVVVAVVVGVVLVVVLVTGANCVLMASFGVSSSSFLISTSSSFRFFLYFSFSFLCFFLSFFFFLCFSFFELLVFVSSSSSSTSWSLSDSFFRLRFLPRTLSCFFSGEVVAVLTIVVVVIAVVTTAVAAVDTVVDVVTDVVVVGVVGDVTSFVVAEMVSVVKVVSFVGVSEVDEFVSLISLDVLVFSESVGVDCGEVRPFSGSDFSTELSTFDVVRLLLVGRSSSLPRRLFRFVFLSFSKDMLS